MVCWPAGTVQPQRFQVNVPDQVDLLNALSRGFAVLEKDVRLGPDALQQVQALEQLVEHERQAVRQGVQGHDPQVRLRQE